MINNHNFPWYTWKDCFARLNALFPVVCQFFSSNFQEKALEMRKKKEANKLNNRI